MVFVVQLDGCKNYSNLLGLPSEDEGIADSLKAVNVALKSRKTRTLRRFQKKRYGVAPTLIGLHAVR